MTVILGADINLEADSRAEIPSALHCIPYIQDPVQFRDCKIQASIYSDSEVNAITPTYLAKLGLTTLKTSIEA